MEDDIDRSPSTPVCRRAGLAGAERGPHRRSGQCRDALGRLHEKGLISDPVGKAKSVAFTQKGLMLAEGLFDQMFARKK
jgi:hypothetical protein